MTRGSVSRLGSCAGSRPPSAGNARETHFFAASSESFSRAAFCLPLVTQLRRLDCPMMARRRRDDVLEEIVAARVIERPREWMPRSASAAWCLSYRARRRRASTDRPSGSAFHSRDSKTRSKTPLHARGVQRSDNTIPFMLLFFFRGKKNWTGRGEYGVRGADSESAPSRVLGYNDMGCPKPSWASAARSSAHSEKRSAFFFAARNFLGINILKCRPQASSLQRSTDVNASKIPAQPSQSGRSS